MVEKLRLSKITSGFRGETCRETDHLAAYNHKRSVQVLLGPASCLNPDTPAKEETVLFKKAN